MTVTQIRKQNKVAVAKWSELGDRAPTYALVGDVDLVVLRYDDEVSVLYGRCLHRGALMADARVEGDNLICGLHGWDYRCDTGVSSYNNAEALQKFRAWVDHEADAVLVDEEEIRAWAEKSPQPYDREAYLGLYADVHGTPEEPFNGYIQELARNGLKKVGHDGPLSAMGVPRQQLPLGKTCCSCLRNWRVVRCSVTRRSDRRSSSGPRPRSPCGSTSRCSSVT